MKKSRKKEKQPVSSYYVSRRFDEYLQRDSLIPSECGRRVPPHMKDE